MLSTAVSARARETAPKTMTSLLAQSTEASRFEGRKGVGCIGGAYRTCLGL